jgi:pimeloyl-ACP methyl ester carboxylesterase
MMSGSAGGSDMAAENAMHTILSPDRTRIAFEKRGSGPPLILVHGTSADHTSWNAVVDGLSRESSVFSMDRRGRGGSGDGGKYRIELEFHDIAGLANSLHEPVNLLGHSFGAICALGAAPQIERLRSLILYEAPLWLKGMIYPEPLVQHMKDLMRAHDDDALLRTFLHDLVGIDADQIAAAAAAPAWAANVATAHTIVREVEAVGKQYAFEPGRFQKLTAPVLLLVGSESPPFFREPMDLLSRALPNCRLVELAGQRHVAHVAAPQMFVEKVSAFLREPERSAGITDT